MKKKKKHRQDEMIDTQIVDVRILRKIDQTPAIFFDSTSVSKA